MIRLEGHFCVWINIAGLQSLLLLSFSFHILGQLKDKLCTASVDIGFIMDSSESLRSHYSDEKDFIKQVAKGFGISQHGTRAGLVLFSNNAEVGVQLGHYGNTYEFQTAVDNLPLLGGSKPRIDKALKVAYDQVFSPSYKSRPKTPKVLVLLTDSKQSRDADAIDLSLAALPFHEAGIKVIVVGVGESIKYGELRTVVKSLDNLFFARDFDQLKSESFVKDVINLSCKVSGKYPSFYYICVTDIF